MMKQLTLAATFLLALAATPLASAKPRVNIGDGRIVVTGRGSCGCPVHSRQVCTGYDRLNRPIYTNYRQPFICGCKKDSRHANARRKFLERRDNEFRNHQERLRKVYADYHRDLDKAHDKHEREMRDISRERNPRKYHERRANEERNHRERLRKAEHDYQRDLEKVRDKHQRELDDQYRDYLRAIR